MTPFVFIYFLSLLLPPLLDVFFSFLSVVLSLAPSLASSLDLSLVSSLVFLGCSISCLSSYLIPGSISCSFFCLWFSFSNGFLLNFDQQMTKVKCSLKKNKNKGAPPK